MTFESLDRTSFFFSLCAHVPNSCSLLIKPWVALVFPELRVVGGLCELVTGRVCASVSTQPWQATDWWPNESRMLHRCYRLAQRKPGRRSAPNYTRTHTHTYIQNVQTLHFFPPSTAEHPRMGVVACVPSTSCRCSNLPSVIFKCQNGAGNIWSHGWNLKGFLHGNTAP